MLLVSFLRTVFFYFFLLAVIRIMGKRELGSLGPLDLVVTIIMAEAAAIPIENPERPLLLGVIPIVVLLLLEMGLSFLMLKSRVVRSFFTGPPSVVIRNGKLMRGEMRRLRYSVHDLLEQLRVRGFYHLSDVDIAILESDGELSVLPKSSRRPLSPSDLGLHVPEEEMGYTFVVDGKVDHQALQEAGVSEASLHAMLAEQGVHSLDEVFVALFEHGQLVVQKH